MRKTIRRAVVLLFVVCVLCMSGCGEAKREEPTTKTTAGSLTGALLGSSNPYGRSITKNGIKMYVDGDGVTTGDIVSDGYTFVNAEYMESASSAPLSRWIGFDGAGHPFEDGSVFRVQPITKMTDNREYQECCDMIDGNISDKYPADSVTFFRVWIEKKNGTKTDVFDPALDVLFEQGDVGFTEACGISEGSDEMLEHSDTVLNVPAVGERRFFRVRLRHNESLIALFTE